MENVESIEKKTQDFGFLYTYLSHQTTARLHILTFPLDFSFPPVTTGNLSDEMSWGEIFMAHPPRSHGS